MPFRNPSTRYARRRKTQFTVSGIDRHRRPAILFFGIVTTAYRLRSRPLFVSNRHNARKDEYLKRAFRKFGLAINEFPLSRGEFLKKFRKCLRIKVKLSLQFTEDFSPSSSN